MIVAQNLNIPTVTSINNLVFNGSIMSVTSAVPGSSGVHKWNVSFVNPTVNGAGADVTVRIDSPDGVSYPSIQSVWVTYVVWEYTWC